MVFRDISGLAGHVTIPSLRLSLLQATEDWHTCPVTLSATKGLSERCFAEFILSEAEGFNMAVLK